MKYVICVPDGASDEPVEELGGRTPLEAAAMPVLAGLARRGEVGRAATIPRGFPPGSDVGNMSILGYDPARYHTGRAPIEAAALGIDIGDDQVAFRCNLVRVEHDNMADFAGGHPTNEQAAAVIADLDRQLGGDGVSFHPGVQYRHIMLAPAGWADAECTPPHDLTDKPAVWPTGPAAPDLQRLMDASQQIVPRPGLAANQIWLWGQGRRPTLPPFEQTTGLKAGLVSAVDLVRGLGALTGIDIADVPGITGWYDTNYEGKRDAAIHALGEGGKDLFLIHVEASDEAGHAGDVAAKVAALENWDRRILGPLIPALDDIAHGQWRLLLLPDHPTPLRLKTHTDDSVPYLIVDGTSRPGSTGAVYSEAATAAAVPVAGHTLVSRLTTRTG
jgi:2,3-bisphosphoglycerate-independent phosphoglycerate mutase